MIRRSPGHYGDPTCSSAVRAGDFLFLAHHGGGYDGPDYAHQVRAALISVGETLGEFGADYNNVVQVTLWVREFTPAMRDAWDVFGEFFEGCAPARMTATTDFFDQRCLVQIEATAYLGNDQTGIAARRRV